MGVRHGSFSDDGTFSDDEDHPVSSVPSAFPQDIDQYIQGIYALPNSINNLDSFNYLKPLYDNADRCVKYYDARTDEEIKVVFAGVVSAEGTFLGPYGNKAKNSEGRFKTGDLNGMKYTIGISCPERCSQDLEWDFAAATLRLSGITKKTLEEYDLKEDNHLHDFVRYKRDTSEMYIPVGTRMFRNFKMKSSLPPISESAFKAARELAESSGDKSGPWSLFTASSSSGSCNVRAVWNPQASPNGALGAHSPTPVVMDLRDRYSRYSAIPETMLRTRQLNRPNICDQQNRRINPLDLERIVVPGTPVVVKVNMRFHHIKPRSGETKPSSKAFICVLKYLRMLPPIGDVDVNSFLMAAASLSGSSSQGDNVDQSLTSEELANKKREIARSVAKPVLPEELFAGTRTNSEKTGTRRTIPENDEHRGQQRSTRSTSGKGKRKATTPVASELQSSRMTSVRQTPVTEIPEDHMNED
ncbi:hypothetical protein FRB99_001347 [Tulasnella sp. 403]|nr:hypothetical protein FRB99_001347 [Tulasnella sp. 403]